MTEGAFPLRLPCSGLPAFNSLFASGPICILFTSGAAEKRHGLAVANLLISDSPASQTLTSATKVCKVSRN